MGQVVKMANEVKKIGFWAEQMGYFLMGNKNVRESKEERKECKTQENSNFLKKGKMIISVKIQNFSRSQMMKRTSRLGSSHEI